MVQKLIDTLNRIMDYSDECTEKINKYQNEKRTLRMAKILVIFACYKLKTYAILLALGGLDV